MKILLCGVPVGVAGRVAARYGLGSLSSLDDDAGGRGALLPIRPVESPAGLLSLCQAMLAHEAEIGAVVLCGTQIGDLGNAVRYCSPQDKFYTLCGDDDDEGLEYELGRIIETRLGLICAHEGIRPLCEGCRAE